MAKNSIFFQKYQSYSAFSCQSHLIKSELGQIYSLSALNTDTGVITGQKWAIMAKICIFINQIIVIQNFGPFLTCFWPVKRKTKDSFKISYSKGAGKQGVCNKQSVLEYTANTSRRRVGTNGPTGHQMVKASYSR